MAGNSSSRAAVTGLPASSTSSSMRSSTASTKASTTRWSTADLSPGVLAAHAGCAARAAATAASTSSLVEEVNEVRTSPVAGFVTSTRSWLDPGLHSLLMKFWTVSRSSAEDTGGPFVGFVDVGDEGWAGQGARIAGLSGRGGRR